MSDAFPIDSGILEAAAAQAGCANISDTDEITVTVTPSAKPASDTPTVAEFMSAVVAWPGPQEPGQSLHYSMPNPRPNPKQPFLIGAGWPYRDVNKRVSRAAWVNTVADKSFCTSSRRRQPRQ
jgi:hypothetical protein